MEGKCIVSGCGKAASKCCGSCGLVRYCSVECQKEDWKKLHKKYECVNMRKLVSVPWTGQEIYGVAAKISCISNRHEDIGEYERSTHLYKECIDFVRYHLGRSDCDKSGSLIDNVMISSLLVSLGMVYLHMEPSSEIDSHFISYTSEARELLVQVRDAGMNDRQMWLLLMRCDRGLHQLYEERGQSEKAKYHIVEFVATARHYKGPDHVEHLIRSLGMHINSLRGECKHLEALDSAEEAYIIASKHFSPAHKTVLEAGGQLIDCLIVLKDYSTANTYCRMNYSNLTDPMNAGEYDSEDGIKVMGQLVNIWLEKEPDDDEIVAKALADEAIDLSRRCYAYVVPSAKRLDIKLRKCHLLKLCEVLLKVNQLTEETEGLLHQLVTMCIADDKFDRSFIHTSFELLSRFYSKLNESFPVGKKSKSVLENIELCEKLILEFESSDEGSVGYVKISQKIEPYFKSNAELCI